MSFPADVNGHLFYQSPDGREGFVIFDRDKKLAYFGTDINSEHNFLVGFTAEALRRIADSLDQES